MRRVKRKGPSKKQSPRQSGGYPLADEVLDDADRSLLAGVAEGVVDEDLFHKTGIDAFGCAQNAGTLEVVDVSYSCAKAAQTAFDAFRHFGSMFRTQDNVLVIRWHSSCNIIDETGLFPA